MTHSSHISKGKLDQSMRMLVLAGGFGSRLQSVVNKVPKALAPIGEIPFLRYQIENWTRQGVRSFVFLLHHQAEIAVEFLNNEKRGSLIGCEFDWVIESVPMGTGGALANAIRQQKIKGDFLVANADTWLSSGVVELSGLGSPVVAVVNVNDAERYGSIEFDADFSVSRFIEKSYSAGGAWINAGLSMLNAELFNDFDVGTFSLEEVAFPRWVQEGILAAKPLTCDFIDIGVPKDYYRFCRWVESGRMGAL